MKVTASADGSWTYFQDTVMQIRGRPEPFHHTDENTLGLIAPPTPNPLARQAAGLGRRAPSRSAVRSCRNH